MLVASGDGTQYLGLGGGRRLPLWPFMLLNLNNIKVLAIQKIIFKYNEERNQISYELDNSYKGYIAVFNKWWLMLSFSTPAMSYSYLDFREYREGS